MINVKKIKGRIVEKGYNLSSFSKIIGLSRTAFRRRMNGTSDFKVSEIDSVCLALEIPGAEMADYFFVRNVSESDTRCEK